MYVFSLIQAVSLKIQTLKSQSAMANAMKGVTKAMTNMNRQMKLPEIQKIMMEFEKQSEIMDMKEEMMTDVIGKQSYTVIHHFLLYTSYPDRSKSEHLRLRSHPFKIFFSQMTP